MIANMIHRVQMETFSFFSIGYGGQGQAWLPSLVEAGLQTQVVLRRNGASWKSVENSAFSSHLCATEDLPARLKPNSFCLLLIPDREIGSFYEKHLKDFSGPLNIVVATGFAIWADQLKTRPNHEVHLLGPKAIGPELRRNIVQHRPNHSLKAAITETSLKHAGFQQLLGALGFSESNCIPCTFEQEAVGDLISEQLLLCGGLFTLLEETLSAMRSAGIPEALIQEECGTELVLIAKMLSEKGLEKTRAAISDTAKIGAKITTQELKNSDLSKVLHSRVDAIRSKKFVRELYEHANSN